MIPDIIKSQYSERYCESSELDTIIFYERARNDKFFNPTVEIADYDSIKKIIEKSILQGYDRFILFENTNELADYSKPVNDILNKYVHLDITVIKVNALGYPLAHMAIDSEKIVKTTDSIDNVMSYINSVRDSFKVYFYSPKENVLPSIKRVDFDDDVISSSTNGKLFLYDGSLSEIKKDKESYLEKLFELYMEDIEDNKVVPFIMYTNNYSLYNDVIERKLLSIFLRLKTIKKYPIPAVLGQQVGYNAVGVGFIKKVEE